MYESDVFGPDGHHLDKRYLTKRRAGERWSTWLFGKQHIPPGHFRLWKQALQQLAPGGRRRRALGSFVNHGHKRWEWRYDPTDDVVLESLGNDEGYTLYEKSEELTTQRRGDIYTEVATVYPTHDMSICLVKSFPDSSIQRLHTAAPAPSAATPSYFLEVLREWGCTWLWDKMKMTNSTGKGMDMVAAGEGQWIAEAIADNSL